MAIIKDPNDQDQQGGQLGSQASASVTGGAGGMTQGTASAPTGSGNFTNLQSYMNANQGNEAVKNSVGDIAAKGDEAQKGFNDAKGAYEGLSVTGPQGLSNENQTFLDKKSNIPGTQSYASQKYYGGDMDQGLAAAKSNIDNIKYTGPSAADIGAKSDAYGTAKAGVDTASRLFEASPDGVANRKQALTDTNTQRASGNYTGGQAKLDSFLVEGQGNSAFDPQRQALSQLAGGYDKNAIGAHTQDLQGQATTATNSANQMHDKAQGQFNQVQSMWDKTNALRNAQATAPQQTFSSAAYAQPAKPIPTYAPLPTHTAPQPTAPTYNQPTSSTTDRRGGKNS